MKFAILNISSIQRMKNESLAMIVYLARAWYNTSTKTVPFTVILKLVEYSARVSNLTYVA